MFINNNKFYDVYTVSAEISDLVFCKLGVILQM